MNKIEFKTSGLLSNVILGLFLTVILLFINFFIFKLSTNTFLIFYFVNIIISIIASYAFRGILLLKIKNEFLYIKWLKKPFYTSIKNSKIKLNTILKSTYQRGSRGPDRMKIIVETSSKPVSISISSSNSAEAFIESSFHKILVSKIKETSFLDQKLASPYYHKYCSWIYWAKISISILIALSVSLGVYLASYNEIEIIQHLFIISFCGLITAMVVFEAFKYTRKEFLLEE